MLKPTEYADVLYSHAKRWGADYRLMNEEFNRIRAQERCEIRLGISLGILGFMGLGLIEGFQEAHPSVSVSYNELSDSSCDASLLNGTYDLALTLAPYDNRFITTELYKTQVCFWVNLKKGFKGKEALEISDLDDKDIAMPGENYKIYNTILGLCKNNAVTPGNLYASNEIFWLYEYVASGKGIAFCLPHLAELKTFSQDENIVSLPLNDVYWRFGISYLSSHKLLPYEKQFVEYLQANRFDTLLH